MMLALCVAGKFGEPPDKLEPVDVSSGSPMPFLNALDPVEWICFTAVFRKLTAKSPLLKRADCRANSYGILPMRNDHDHCHTLPLKATGYQKWDHSKGTLSSYRYIFSIILTSEFLISFKSTTFNMLHLSHVMFPPARVTSAAAAASSSITSLHSMHSSPLQGLAAKPPPDVPNGWNTSATFIAHLNSFFKSNAIQLRHWLTIGIVRRCDFVQNVFVCNTWMRVIHESLNRNKHLHLLQQKNGTWPILQASSCTHASAITWRGSSVFLIPWFMIQIKMMQIKPFRNANSNSTDHMRFHTPASQTWSFRNCSGSDTPSSWASVASVSPSFHSERFGWFFSSKQQESLCQRCVGPFKGEQ